MSPKRKVHLKIGELLVENEIITKDQLEEALAFQRTRSRGKMLGQILKDMGLLKEDNIYSAMAIQAGYPYIKVANCIILPEVLNLISKAQAENSELIPLDKIGNILTLAMSNPFRESSVAEIEKAAGLEVKIFYTPLQELKEAIEKNYGTEKPAGT